MGTVFFGRRPSRSTSKRSISCLDATPEILTRSKDPEAEARRVENRRLRRAKRPGAAYSEYWGGKVLMLNQFDSRFCVSFPVAEHLILLKIFIGKKVYEILKESLVNAVIRFSDEKGLFLTLGDEVLFEKSRQRLSEISQYGPHWVAQLDKELAKQKLRSRSNERKERKSMTPIGSDIDKKRSNTHEKRRGEIEELEDEATIGSRSFKMSRGPPMEQGNIPHAAASNGSRRSRLCAPPYIPPGIDGHLDNDNSFTGLWPACSTAITAI
jgi:hypothetical protein